MGMIRAKDLQAVLGKPRARALGIATASAMNRTEQAYAAHLETRRVAGEVWMYTFEAVRLRLADRTYYVPDFLVWLPDGSVEVHEVKGYWQDDARAEGRGENDTKHICPLQLGVIDRLVRLYTNPGEVVFSPFTGIGSEGYIALSRGRRFYGCEIKHEYLEAAKRNMVRAIARRDANHQNTLFVA